MAKLILTYWRDIPAQVTVKAGRKNAKRILDERFEKAIDHAAMRAGLRDTDSYLAHWRKGDPQDCGNDLEAAADDAATAIERDYPPERLAQMVKNGGLDTPA